MSDLTRLHNALCITRNLTPHSSTKETAILEILGGAGLRVSWMARDGKVGKHFHPPEACPRGSTKQLEWPGEWIVFQGRDHGHISTRQNQRLLDDAAEKAGIQETRSGKVRQRKRITPHLLRHSFSRWSLDAGIDISYLQQQLGHSSLSTTAIYLRARPNHRRNAYEKARFDELLSSLVDR